MDAVNNKQIVEEREDASWRNLVSQARLRRQAEWAVKNKGLKPYVTGAECASNLLKLWDLYDPRDGEGKELGFSEAGSHTLSELVTELSKVAEVEVRCADSLASAMAETPVLLRTGDRDELWNWLCDPESPVMVALESSWTIVQSIRHGKTVVCYDRYRQEMETTEFRRQWDRAANIGIRLKSLRREVVSGYSFVLMVPQWKLRPPADLEYLMDEPEEPLGLDDTLRNYEELGARLHASGERYPIEPRREDLCIIGNVLMEHQEDESDRYWEIIKKGGLPGYAMFIFQMVRIGWCFEQVPPLNPCASPRFISRRRADQPLGVITEHMFLQLVSLGKLWKAIGVGEMADVSIGELVLANPITKDPHQDWLAILELDRLGKCFLSEADKREDPVKIEAARKWYRENGFENGWGAKITGLLRS